MHGGHTIWQLKAKGASLTCEILGNQLNKNMGVYACSCAFISNSEYLYSYIISFIFQFSKSVLIAHKTFYFIEYIFWYILGAGFNPLYEPVQSLFLLLLHHKGLAGLLFFALLPQQLLGLNVLGSLGSPLAVACLQLMG